LFGYALTHTFESTSVDTSTRRGFAPFASAIVTTLRDVTNDRWPITMSSGSQPSASDVAADDADDDDDDDADEEEEEEEGVGTGACTGIRKVSPVLSVMTTS
jgi:hypothetical protein